MSNDKKRTEPQREFDNVQPVFQEITKKKRLRKRWLLFSAAVLVILLVLMLVLMATTTSLDGMKRFFRYLGDDPQPVSIDSYTDAALLEDKLLIANQSGAALYDGAVLGRYQGAFSSPALRESEEHALFFDIGGTHFALLNRKGETLYEKTTAAALYDADLSKSGAAAVLYAGTESRAVLEVYSAAGTLLYRRSSNTQYLNACAVSPSADYAAVSTLGQEDIAYRGSVQLLRTDSEEVFATVDMGAQLLYDLSFLTDERLCAIGSDTLVFFTTEGEIVSQYAVTNGELLAYSFGGDGFISAVYDLYSATNRYRLLLFGADGTVLAAADLPAAPLSLDSNGSYTAVLTADTLFLYDQSLSLRSSTESLAYSAALARTDGTAYCLTDDEALLYIP